MANQHDNVRIRCLKKYGIALEEKLKEISTTNLTLNDLCDDLGFRVVTMRKYCKLYNIEMKANKLDFEKNRMKKDIEKYSFLSKEWK